MKFSVGFFAAGAAAAALNNDAAAWELEQLSNLAAHTGLRYSPTFARLMEKEMTENTLEKRQLAGLLGPNLLQCAAALLGSSAGGGPKSLVADVQETPAQIWKDVNGVKGVKIRYGPYRMPGTAEDNALTKCTQVKGMSSSFSASVKKPCTGECTILTLWANLEYEDGTSANNTNGAWLHHNVLLASGPGRKDANCAGLPMENIFMSGNERTTGGFALPGSKVKSGFNVKATDSFLLQTELMNMDEKAKWAWLTINYEYLPGPQPDYRQSKTIWSSIGPLPPCPGTKRFDWGPSNLTLTQQPKVKVFSEHSQPWRVPQDGLLMSTGGHLHDGGVSLQIYKNSNNNLSVICDSVSKYSEHGGGMSMGRKMKRDSQDGPLMASGEAKLHIDHQEICLFPEGYPIKKDDLIYLQANYDFDQHPGMKNTKGELDEIMGIVGTLVVF